MNGAISCNSDRIIAFFICRLKIYRYADRLCNGDKYHLCVTVRGLVVGQRLF